MDELTKHGLRMDELFICCEHLEHCNRQMLKKISVGMVLIKALVENTYKE
jgi:hypothetical protein